MNNIVFGMSIFIGRIFLDTLFILEIMSKRNFTKEFRQTLVDLVNSGHKVSALSKEYNIA